MCLNFSSMLLHWAFLLWAKKSFTRLFAWFEFARSLRSPTHTHAYTLLLNACLMPTTRKSSNNERVEAAFSCFMWKLLSCRFQVFCSWALLLCFSVFICCRYGIISLPASGQNISGRPSCSWLFGFLCRSGNLKQKNLLAVCCVSCSVWGLFNLSWLPQLSSYYGLTVWFPDMIKYIQKQEYESRTKTFTKERVEHVTFNFTLENQVHRQGYYFNDK